MKIKCPFCGSEKLYFRFDLGFDWDNQAGIVTVDCEECDQRFGAWVAPIGEICLPEPWFTNSELREQDISD